MSAYDLWGTNPRSLWMTGPTENSALRHPTRQRSSPITAGLFHDVVIDKATGAQTRKLRKRVIAVADDIVVTINSTTTTCSGWMRGAAVDKHGRRPRRLNRIRVA